MDSFIRDFYIFAILLMKYLTLDTSVVSCFESEVPHSIIQNETYFIIYFYCDRVIK